MDGDGKSVPAKEPEVAKEEIPVSPAPIESMESSKGKELDVLETRLRHHWTGY